jgi:hypothetical protein
MKKIQFIVSAAMMLFLLPNLQAQQPLEYCNNRFGFCVTYPVDLHLAQDRPINGDGIILEANGGSIVVNISGAHNIMEYSPERLYEFEKMEFEEGQQNGVEELRLTTDSEGFQAVLAGDKDIEAIRMWRLNGSYAMISIRGPKSERERIEALWKQIRLSINS